MSDPAPVPFHVPPIEESDVAAVVEVLRRGWLTTGPKCAEFEGAFAAHLGGDVECVAVNSATSALHLALEAIGVGAGDRVIVPTYTFTATAEVVRYLDADPVLADVDPTTGNITPDTVEAAYQQLTLRDRRRVTALMPVHFAGLACDMTGLGELVDDHGWRVVDDAAHALPATHRGRPVGRLGDATAFSFYATKPLCTGEGGMVTTRDHRLAARMRTMRLHGIDRDVFDRYATPNQWYYEVVAPGFKYNLTDLAAALGLSQLRRVSAYRARRAAIAAAYTRAFSGVCGLATPPDAPAGGLHAWHLYPLRVTAGMASRNHVIERLAARGVGSSVHFIPLHRQPYYRDRYRLRPTQFPGAEQLYAGELSLPIFPTMTDDQVQRVIDAVQAATAEVTSSRTTAAEAQAG